MSLTTGEDRLPPTLWLDQDAYKASLGMVLLRSSFQDGTSGGSNATSYSSSKSNSNSQSQSTYDQLALAPHSPAGSTMGSLLSLESTQSFVGKGSGSSPRTFENTSSMASASSCIMEALVTSSEMQERTPAAKRSPTGSVTSRATSDAFKSPETSPQQVYHPAGDSNYVPLGSSVRTGAGSSMPRVDFGTIGRSRATAMAATGTGSSETSALPPGVDAGTFIASASASRQPPARSVSASLPRRPSPTRLTLAPRRPQQQQQQQQHLARQDESLSLSQPQPQSQSRSELLSTRRPLMPGAAPASALAPAPAPAGARHARGASASVAASASASFFPFASTSSSSSSSAASASASLSVDAATSTWRNLDHLSTKRFRSITTIQPSGHSIGAAVAAAAAAGAAAAAAGAPPAAVRLSLPLRSKNAKNSSKESTGPGRSEIGTAPQKEVGLQLMDLLPELLQTVMDWLPTFESRARLQFVNRTLRGLEWRWGAPLKLEEELSGLQLGDLGCEAVVAAAEAGTTLGELCLGDNGIGDRGAKALARMLANPTSTLRRLSLRNNCIGEEGAHILATALATNTMLEELDLWGNELSDRAKAELLTSGQCEVFLSLPRVLSPAVPIDEVNGRMRAILLDWISQLHTGVSSPVPGEAAPDPQDMLFRTFSHVDARLESQVVKREDLQLLGIACTLVAAGLGLGAEGGPEDLELASWLAFVTDGACTTEEVRAAAQSTRETLRFKLHQPTAYTFLRRYLRRTGWSEESFSLANYLIELATIDQGFLRFRPQAVAASAAVLSRQYSARNVPVRQMPRWRKKLLRCSNVDLEAELAPCLAAMSRLHVMQHGRSSMFVNKKYEWSRLHAVARIEPNEPQPARSWVLYMRSELLL